GGVARERHAGHREGVAAGESQGRLLRDLAEGMAPAGGRVQRRRHAGDPKAGRGAQAERAEGQVAVLALALQAGRAVLLEAVAGEMHPGEAGEGLQARAATGYRIADLAEDLRRARLVLAL